MEEFIFGTYATDALKLVHHRASLSGLQHQHDLAPRDPAPGEPVLLRAFSGPDLNPDFVACYYTTDGSEPDGGRGVARNGSAVLLERAGQFWDTLAWGYVAEWHGRVPGQPEGVTVRYRIGAWAGDAHGEVFADWPDVDRTAENAGAAFFRGEPLPPRPAGDPHAGHTFCYHVDRLRPPEWARQAVIYQVFVDRFHPGRGRGWLQTSDLGGFCGGTLWGVAEKMDYIADLGATCVWLSPIFVSPTHHGYDATDLLHVEPRLGGDEALRAVVAAAHTAGIRVLLDYACNHISNLHPVFQSALDNPNSSCRDWFTFDDSPPGYRSFFGVPSMPQLNHANREVAAWLIDVARYWLREFDVDGYRLDYANGPGPDFWPEFWAACKEIKPDSFCFGEIVDTPEVQRRYVGRLDGCLDFHLGDMLRRTYGFGSRSPEDLDRFVRMHESYFPPDLLRPTFVDNHDMDRFLFIAGGDKAALRAAVARQMRLPGPPIIYQGTEVGVRQGVGKDAGLGLEVNRVPMAWGEEQDHELLEFFRKEIRDRKARQAAP